MDTTNVNGQNDTVTKYILKVSDNIEVDVKTDKPSLEKKIWHNDTTATPTISESAAPEFNSDVLGQGWADVGDNQIGDTVYYVTKTAVPDMQYYDTYKYIIHDEMGVGLTPGNVEKIVYIDKAGNATLLSNIESNKDGQKLTINFGDLKNVLKNGNGDSIANGGYIYTYYTATLDADALISNTTNDTQGNPNTAYLEYSNNPNFSGTGDTGNTGKTPDDVVYDWTFTFSGVKVDNSSPAKPVGGAGFKLTAGSSTEAINLVEVSSTNVKDVTADDTMVYYRIALPNDTTGVVDEILTTKEKNKFMILGLDDSVVYTLTETTTPDGYNTCDPITIDLTAGYESSTKLNVLNNGTDSEGNAKPNSETIVNNKGTSLPGTGGIGTTIFYLGGGAMAAIGGIYLISKRRMKKSEE